MNAVALTPQNVDTQDPERTSHHETPQNGISDSGFETSVGPPIEDAMDRCDSHMEEHIDLPSLSLSIKSHSLSASVRIDSAECDVPLEDEMDHDCRGTQNVIPFFRFLSNGLISRRGGWLSDVGDE